MFDAAGDGALRSQMIDLFELFEADELVDEILPSDIAFVKNDTISILSV